MKIVSPEEKYKMDNYFIKIKQHLKCQERPLFGGDLWTHIKKCETKIPEPEIWGS